MVGRKKEERRITEETCETGASSPVIFTSIGECISLPFSLCMCVGIINCEIKGKICLLLQRENWLTFA